jgi:tripartite ATP-independent transporter DctP family solute receptor
MSTFCRLCVRLVLTLVLVVSFGAAFGQPITIRLGWTTSDSPLDPYAITAHEFAAALEELAPGQFDVRFFPSNQLGDERQMLEGMTFGTLDAGVITGTAIATMEPAFQLNDLPFLYGSREDAHRVLDGSVGQELLNRLEPRGIIGLGFSEAGFRHTINNVRPINTPEDYSGIKLRMQPSQIFIDSFQALGANPVPMAWGETFTAVQQGTVDGLEIPLAVIAANRFSEVTDYLSLTGHAYNALALLMAQSTFNKLSSEQQDIVRQAAEMAIERQREMNAENQEHILEQLQEQGFQINEVENPAAFRERTLGVYEEYRESIGSELVDRALEEVDSSNANQ